MDEYENTTYWGPNLKRYLLPITIIAMFAFLGAALAQNSHASSKARGGGTPNAYSGTTPNSHSTTTGNTDMGNQLCILVATNDSYKNPGMMMQYIRQNAITLSNKTVAGYENAVQWLENFPGYHGTVGDWINRNCHGTGTP